MCPAVVALLSVALTAVGAATSLPPRAGAQTSPPRPNELGRVPILLTISKKNMIYGMIVRIF